MLQFFKNFYHLGQAILANIWYGFPSRKLTIIGVTGTDGKTTTASLIHAILKQAGQNASLITTVGAAIGKETIDTGFHVTTPSPFALQKYLRRIVAAGSRMLVLEVTSHGLDQNRVFGIRYRIGVLTNISHEHLDYHQSFNRYLKAKLQLFKLANTCILNLDDVTSYEKISRSLPGKKIRTYSLHNETADLTLKKFPFTTKLSGDFNYQNCLAAAEACRELGITDELIRQAINVFQPPIGRQQTVYDGEFRVIVDFAHTPNAFKQFLPELKAQTNGRLIHIFGAAGLRDSLKRPGMGKISSQFSDVIILTAEDPRTEPLSQINQQILSGIEGFVKEKIASTGDQANGKKMIFEIPDRQQAIDFAIRTALPGDVIAITGKGHEQSMNILGTENAWSEHQAVEQALSKRFNAQ